MSGERDRRVDGKAVAEEILSEVAQQTADFARRMRQPFITVVVVGQNPASQAYVRSKVSAAARCGIASSLIELEADIEAARLLDRIDCLNADPGVDAILV
ncbi:MAG: tetrahydrofolate dehydrogenase/cyclohydrolase catalytic domain-containing protein, partial [Candidatus Krumholzibacteria bacterium]|nr:tetrahydrofolate dehydrogenase/cyclohydrolase catalytic domain-containing protein [Candidatus Krumholzibacteria bacterium]